MKVLTILAILYTSIGFTQTNAEVYLLNLDVSARTISNPINISSNEGYDNQPSFSTDDTILYTRTRDKQTDIADYNLLTKVTSWHTETGYGSEYSPIQIPENTEIAAVRLDTSGLQKLYLYNERKDASRPLSDSLVVGYHAWLNPTELITFVLGDESTLVYLNINTQDTKLITSNIGRSLHKVPDSQLMSYTSINEDGVHEVYLLDIKDNFKSFFVCELPIGIQDYTWVNRDMMLLGSENTLYTYDTFVDEDWQKLASLESYNLKGITRLDVSPNGKFLVIVVEE